MVRRIDINTDHLLYLYNTGIGIDQLADNFGVGTNTIRRRLADFGIYPTKRIDIDIPELLKMYDSGASVKKIAAHFGCARQVITLRLSENGITPRNRSESLYLRMSQTSPEERSRITSAAHAAVRGKSQTDEHRCKIAINREINQIGISRTETMFVEMLEKRGMLCTQQKAIGRYNIDVALNECPVVVEIFGGGWHGSGSHAAGYTKRLEYLLNRGLTVVIVWVDAKLRPLESGAADYVIAVANELGSQKPIRGKEHVIRGDGNLTTIGRRKFNNLPIIPCSERRDNITGRFK